MEDKFNIFISTNSHYYNIFLAEKHELDKLIHYYNIGKETIYINGTKYWIDKIFQIKIFSVTNSDQFNRNLPKIKNFQDLPKDMWGKKFLAPEHFSDWGEDITRNYITKDYGELKHEETDNHSSNVKTSEKTMNIFISHSNKDLDKVRALVNLIVKALYVDADSIRCTSLPGYKLPVGTDTNTHLKKEIFDSNVFIAVLTNHSIKSNYVLFELGARWGNGKPLLPLVCDPLGMELLEAPLSSINAISTLDRADIHQVVDNLASHLNIVPQPASSFQDEIEILRSVSSVNTNIGSTNKDIDAEEGYHDADKIIKEASLSDWPDDFAMQERHIKNQQKALQELKAHQPTGVPTDVFEKIRKKAAREWPTDFAMRLRAEIRQVEAYKKIN